MLENLFGVARLALIDPQVVCAIAIDEVVVQRCFRPQSFDALPQTLFIGGKEYRVHELEIGFYYLVRIGAEMFSIVTCISLCCLGVILVMPLSACGFEPYSY